MENYPKKQTTMNGYEIQASSEVLPADGLKELAVEFGIDGATPNERSRQLKGLGIEQVSEFVDSINRGVQGSADSLISDDGTMKIGDKETISVEHRYEVMSELVRLIKDSPDEINPARLGDVLALGVVLLHPFQDGNGRTARIVGSIFRDEYDKGDWENTYKVVAESRDKRREQGGFMINGYIPYLPEGKSQSDPRDVISYLESLLSPETKDDRLYTGPYGQAPLY